MKLLGVILAGGKSTRMKQDKALLKLQSESLLHQQFVLLETLLGEGNVLVSGDRPDFPHIKDLSPGLGPIEGLRAICHHLVNQGYERSLLVIPVDMPFMSIEGLRLLTTHKSESDVSTFWHQQLPALFRDVKRTINEIESLKKEICINSIRDYSFCELFKRLKVDHVVMKDSKNFFTNLNSPEDLHAALS